MFGTNDKFMVVSLYFPVFKEIFMTCYTRNPRTESRAISLKLTILMTVRVYLGFFFEGGIPMCVLKISLNVIS